jgi:hypothetical protein
MLMPQPHMSVLVMRFLKGVRRPMLVLVMRVMDMTVRVGERLMLMFMLVSLRRCSNTPTAINRPEITFGVVTGSCSTMNATAQ